MHLFRGQRRYYRNLRRWTESYSFQINKDGWSSFYHQHVDLRARSRFGSKHRREHLRALFLIFGRMVEQFKEYLKPYEIWLRIDIENSQHDSAYMHTPNPVDDDFPVDFGDIRWDVEPHVLFANLVDTERMQVGNYPDSKEYIVRMKRLAGSAETTK